MSYPGKKRYSGHSEKLNGATSIQQAEINSMDSPKPYGLYG